MNSREQPTSRSKAPGADSASPERWTVITGEYPPQTGGVSDYTYLLARALARDADAVDVWCPGRETAVREEGGVRVHRAMGSFSVSDLVRAHRRMPRDASRRVLVQWVPHAYGRRAMNLGVCVWLWWRSVRQRDRIELIVHETFLEFSNGWKQRAAALIHRVMTVILFRAVVRVWVTVPAWEPRLRPFLLSRRVPFEWLPVPSNVPLGDQPALTDVPRTAIRGLDAIRVGHFGTYGKHIVALLRPVIRELLARDSTITIVLLGRGSTQFRDDLIADAAHLSSRITATGGLPPECLSIHLSLCDIMLQPFPDGVSSRRGSAMAAISHGVPLITTRGVQTEHVWEAVPGIALVEPTDSAGAVHVALRWASDPYLRQVAARTVRDLYVREFSLPRLLARLRSPAAVEK